jgi:phytoene synthase
MTSEDYCYQKAAPTGSVFYYSLLKIPAPARDVITAIQALYVELSEVVFECQDPSTAFTKLNWWRTEVAKLNMGKPDHPVMLVLQKNLQVFNLSPQKFADLIDAIELNVNLPPFENFEELSQQIASTAGLKEILIADVIKSDDVIPADMIAQFSLALELANNIQYLHENVERGLILFTEEDLQKFNVTIAMLYTLKTTSEVRGLLQDQADKAEHIYATISSKLTPAIRGSLRSLIIRCEISFAIVKEIRAAEFQSLENLVTLTPLRYWWLATKSLLKA